MQSQLTNEKVRAAKKIAGTHFFIDDPISTILQ